ncbi:MAG: ABC transporter ATP-binding protein [Muricauda sp.]|nr:peptidase domain-containing ABC transporter [Allomuricauda sp.]MAU14427.1 ABC transporter ATP-binding protein [Allomuricauda sp.]|tara:strand:+ start:6104 stop:8305 length:2202 start_codon:yes stop_codon:yes gene_type:complete
MSLKSFPFYHQLDQKDCGPTCLRMVAKYYGKSFSADFLRKKSNITRDGVSMGGIAEAAEEIGFHTLAVSLNYEAMVQEVPLPCIAHWRQRHFIVIYKITNDTVYVADPAHGLVTYNKIDFLNGWIGKKIGESYEGYLLLMEPTPRFYENELEDKSKYGFKFLFWYFKPYKKYIVQLLLGLFVGSMLQLIFPFLTQAVVDYGINYQNLNFIYLVLIAQLTLFVSQTTVNLIRGWILLHITSRININLISDFLLKLMRLPISFFDSKNTGDIIQRIYDHDRIQDFLSGTTLNTLFSVFNLIVFGFVLAYYNLIIFSIFFLGSLIYIIWMLLFMKKREELDYKRFDQAAENQTSIFQLISGMQEIKLNGSELRRRWEWEAIQIKLFKTSLKSLALSQTQTTGGMFFNELKNILITFIAAKSVIDGNLTLGMMLSIQYIIGQLNLPINNFITFLQAGQDAKISLERLDEIHNKDDEELFNEDIIEELPTIRDIKIKNLSFHYGGKNSPKVLDNINLEIPEGKVTAIVGASGSGKTTLVKLLLKFYEPTRGDIRIDNINLKDIGTSFWRKNCGSVMQDGFLFGDTISRNITESDSEGLIDKKRLLHAIDVANIGDFIEQLPSGLNTKIGSSGVNISGGQKQRILIARSVYKNPNYILFDEATSALDANNEKVIMDKLEKFYEGKTVVVVAHRLSTVKNADQIVVLERGRIIERGNHKELTLKKGLYYSLVKNQLELGS